MVNRVPNENDIKDIKRDNIDGEDMDVHTDEQEESEQRPGGVLYSVEDNPPWYLCIFLGFQHYLTAVGALISTPLVLAPHFCMDQDTVGISEVMGTIFFVSGIATLLQTTFGVRLPIVQGGTFSFVTPTIAIMSQAKWACPYTDARNKFGSSVNFTSIGLPEVGSDGHREIWMVRIREIQGAIMVAALFQVVIGFSGIMGFLLRYIGPLSITPTVALVGFSLTGTGAELASKQWWIALLTIFLIALFSQYMKNIQLPCLSVQRGRGCKTVKLPIFTLFPVLMAIIVVWVVCVILTVTDALPNNPGSWGYEARTDRSVDVLKKSKWFRFPYPGQWGLPTVSVASVFGILAGVLASMVESVGDYYACARLSGAPPPPIHAVNRGIGMEGVACVLTGAWGSGNGTTSYSENIGAIGITKVGSRRVVQVGGCIMLLLGCLGKFGALFTTIPDPVIGGMFVIMFGMVTAVGLSNLQYVDMNSSRNIFIVGVSMYFGLCLPQWVHIHKHIHTGNEIVDQILTVLFETSMFVGGMLGFILDNTIPGTDAERGILAWRSLTGDTDCAKSTSRLHIYNLPVIQKYLDRVPLFKYIPCCPAFMRREQTQSDEEAGAKTDTQTNGHNAFDNPTLVPNDSVADTQL